MASQSRKPRRSAAYLRSTRHYVAGSIGARKITDLILSRLKPVPRSTGLYIYDTGGIFGHLAVRSDRNGLIGFAVYERDPKAKRHRFRRSSMRVAERPIFLTAPTVWAHLHGHIGRDLKPAEYPEWKRQLEHAAGLKKDDAEQPKRKIKYALPCVPDPDSASEGDKNPPPEWAAFEAILGKRLIAPYRRSIYRVWGFFVKRWKETSMTTISGFPCCVKASDGYLAKQFHKSRYAVIRTIKDLDRLGLIQVAWYQRSDLAKMKGIYWYFPGSGRPPSRPTRRPDVTPREVLAYMREVACAERRPSAPIADTGQFLIAEHKGIAQERIGLRQPRPGS